MVSLFHLLLTKSAAGTHAICPVLFVRSLPMSELIRRPNDRVAEEYVDLLVVDVEHNYMQGRSGSKLTKVAMHPNNPQPVSPPAHDRSPYELELGRDDRGCSAGRDPI